MSDLRLSTKRVPFSTQLPQQVGDPEQFFGEQSNDIQLSNINDFDTVEGTEKLKQDINKILLTQLRANTNFLAYGSELQSLIGGKANDPFLRAKIQDEVVASLETLNFVNKENTNEDEVPDFLKTLEIDPVPEGDGFEIKLTVVTLSGRNVSTGIVIVA